MSRSKSLITPLTPNFQGEFARRFDSLCKDLDAVEDEELQYSRFQEEVQWVESRKTNPVEAHRYKTAIMILYDLLSLSWKIDYSPVGLQLYSPSPVQSKGLKQREIREVKKSVRADLMESVNKQLMHPATQDFIRRMEEPHSSSVQKHAITALIADGKELLERLLYAGSLEDSIQPYLQLVDYNQRDDHTGIKLGEIWRYFRLTWSIPYTGVPGRQLFYLIRDAAHPHHAVIGIAALSNSAMQVRDRDNYIGWTLDSFLERMKYALTSENFDELIRLFDLLESYIERGLNEIEQEGLVSSEEVENPTEQVINGLKTQADYFSRARENALKIAQDRREDDEIIDEQGETLADLESEVEEYPVDDEILRMDTRASDDMTPARRWLVLKKRAQELSRLLAARRTLQTLRNSHDLVEALDDAINKDYFRSAVYSALIANKNLQIGINMLEITTCGAVEPYNHILGGKLVSLLMMSPQIVADYKARYENQPSLIASQLANRKVYRPCDLVFLGTTSLYSVGSSQYNRLRLPAGTFHPEQPELRYVPVGATSGFGTVQFSSSTSKALGELESKFLGYRNVNSIFGEGFSPKLRKVRAGLTNLGFDPSVMLKHNQPRLIYAIDLCNVSRQFLLGETGELPEYIRNPTNTGAATEKIAQYWVNRWLSKRIRREDVQERLQNSEGISLKREIQQKQDTQSHPEMPIGEAMNDREELIPEPKNSVSVEFLQRLYRDTSAYSDQLDDTQRAAINIETPLEGYILQKLQQGISVILTGNAGDGKTHVLKRLREQIEAIGAKVILDASVVHPAEIIDEWQIALDTNVPICIAANEWPLFTLIRDFGDFPPLQAVRKQIDQQLIYDEKLDATPDIERDGVVVIDLGKRNHLQKQFFQAALQAVLRDDLYEQCARCHFYKECDTTKNRKLLSNDRVSDRLSELVSRLAVMGYHVTVRELLSTISYMVFGGRVCNTLAKHSGKRSGFYSDQIFSTEAIGNLFDLFRENIDPARISHPHWDVKLTYNDYKDSEWIDSNTIEPSRSDSNISLESQKPIFEHLKRRFYFEHEYGAEVLKMISDDEQRFAALVDPTNTDTEAILDDILEAINAFFCPVIPESEARERLFVWSSHHYDERAPKAFLSKQQIERSKNELVIQKPRLSSSIRDAFDYYPDHVRLVAYPSSEDRRRWLDIDFSLFRVLMDVQRGLPTVLVPEEKSVRLHQFMNALQAVDPNRDVDRQIVWSYTVNSKERINFTVKRSSKQISL